MLYWYETRAVWHPDAPPQFFLGTGKDTSAAYVVHWAGKYLYYLRQDGTATVAKTGAAVKRLAADINGAVFFTGSGDSHALHLRGMGASQDIEKYDADVVGGAAGNVWTRRPAAGTPNCSPCMTTSSGAALATNEVNASLDGANWGATAIKVGDKSYPDSQHALLEWRSVGRQG